MASEGRRDYGIIHRRCNCDLGELRAVCVLSLYVILASNDQSLQIRAVNTGPFPAGVE